MAKSGSTRVNVSPDNYIYLLFSWSSGTPNIVSNYTPVTWRLQLISSNSSANISSSASKDISITVNGTKVYSGTNTVGLNGGSSRTLKTGTINIRHDSDGNKKFSYSFSQEFAITYSGQNIGTKSGSGSGVLDQIKRASILGTVPNFNIGTAFSIPITKNNSSFTDDLTVKYGSTIIKTVVGISNGYSLNFTTAEINNIYSLMPTVTKGTFTFTLTTKSGSTVIGTSSKTSTGTIPSTVKPTISSVALSEAMAGIQAQFGGYVQSKSKIAGTISATGGTGSTISSYSATINGQVYTTSSFTTNYLTKSGSNTVSVTVTDRRGRTSSYSTTFNVLAYESPKITKFTVVRCKSDGTEDNEGEYAKINVSSSVSPVNNKNIKIFKIEYKKKTDSTWTTLSTYTTAYEYVLTNSINPNFSGDDAYNFKLTTTDFFEKPYNTANISTAYTIMDFKGNGKGVAFGKVATKDGVEFGGKVFDQYETEIRNGMAFYEGGGSTDANTVIEELTLTTVNTPNTKFWYVRTAFFSSKTATSNRVQTAFPYNSNEIPCFRYYFNGSWSSWIKIGGNVSANDNQGIARVGDGLLIQWGRISVSVATANTSKTFTFNFAVPYSSRPNLSFSYLTSAPNVCFVSAYGTTNTNGGLAFYRTNTVATAIDWIAIGKE